MTTKVFNRMIEGSPVNVKDFGAVGDGVTDDTDAIQKAMDYVEGLPNRAGVIYFPIPSGGSYRVTRTLTGNTDPTSPSYSMTFLGASASNNGAGGGSIIEMDSLTGDPLLSVDSGFMAENMKFKYPNAKINGTNSSPIFTVICDNYTDVADVDVVFKNCHFIDFHRAIKMVGRGLTFESGAFTGGGSANEECACIDLYLQNPFLPGEFVDQVLTEAQRVYSVRNTRIHATNGALLRNKDTNADLIKGFQITDNYIDTNIKILDGALRDSNITGNTMINSNGKVFDVPDGAAFKDVVISGNVFAGIRQESLGQQYADTSTVTQSDIDARVFTNFVEIGVGCDVSGITIDGNIIKGVLRDVFNTQSDVSELVFTDNNLAEVCKDNKSSGGTTRAVFQFNNNNIVGLTVTGNSVFILDENSVNTPMFSGVNNVVNYEINPNHLKGKISALAFRHSDHDFGGERATVYCGSYTGTGVAQTVKIFAKRMAKALSVTQRTGSNIGQSITVIDGTAAINGVRLASGNQVFADASFNEPSSEYDYVVWF